MFSFISNCLAESEIISKNEKTTTESGNFTPYHSFLRLIQEFF